MNFFGADRVHFIGSVAVGPQRSRAFFDQINRVAARGGCGANVPVAPQQRRDDVVVQRNGGFVTHDQWKPLNGGCCSCNVVIITIITSIVSTGGATRRHHLDHG